MRPAHQQPFDTPTTPTPAVVHLAAQGSDFPTRPMTMLGIWAHPDDESYLSAVLMSRVLRVGGRVVLVSATRGEGGGTGDPGELAVVRERELRAAMSNLGVHDVRFLGHADGGCPTVDPVEATAAIIALIEDVRPDIIVTFGPDGITGHPDHLAVNQWTTAAAMATGRDKLLYATMTDDFLGAHEELHSELGIWMDGEPPQSVPTTDLALHIVPTEWERELKGRTLRAHASQIATLIDMVGADVFDGWWVDEFFRYPTTTDWAGADANLETLYRQKLVQL